LAAFLKAFGAALDRAAVRGDFSMVGLVRSVGEVELLDVGRAIQWIGIGVHKGSSADSLAFALHFVRARDPDRLLEASRSWLDDYLAKPEATAWGLGSYVNWVDELSPAFARVRGTPAARAYARERFYPALRRQLEARSEEFTKWTRQPFAIFDSIYDTSDYAIARDVFAKAGHRAWVLAMGSSRFMRDLAERDPALTTAWQDDFFEFDAALQDALNGAIDLHTHNHFSRFIRGVSDFSSIGSGVVPERKAYAESPVLDAYLHDRFARMRGAFGTTPEGRKKALKVAWRFLNENHSTPAVIDSFVTALDAAVPILTPREFYGYLKCRPFELSGRSSDCFSRSW
jgi:hypothetical protein